MTELEPGEDVKISDPADVGGNYESFEPIQPLRIAEGCLPYDMLTGDLSKTSYSSIRAGILSFRRVLPPGLDCPAFVLVGCIRRPGGVIPR